MPLLSAVTITSCSGHFSIRAWAVRSVISTSLNMTNPAMSMWSSMGQMGSSLSHPAMLILYTSPIAIPPFLPLSCQKADKELSFAHAALERRTPVWPGPPAAARARPTPCPDAFSVRPAAFPAGVTGPGRAASPSAFCPAGGSAGAAQSACRPCRSCSPPGSRSPGPGRRRFSEWPPTPWQ